MLDHRTVQRFLDRLRFVRIHILHLICQIPQIYEVKIVRDLSFGILGQSEALRFRAALHQEGKVPASDRTRHFPCHLVERLDRASDFGQIHACQSQVRIVGRGPLIVIVFLKCAQDAARDLLRLRRVLLPQSAERICTYATLLCALLSLSN